MIEVYKIVANKYEGAVSPGLFYSLTTITIGNKHKLMNDSFHYDLRKYSFTPSVVNTWYTDFSSFFEFSYHDEPESTR